jgi:hypothetical protein
MNQRTRREFLANVGKGMVIAGIGASTAADLGVTFADEEPDRIDFGSLEPLVALMQETPANRLLPVLVERLQQGTELRQLVAAAALANARTFGGEDYIGFHTMMAIGPSLQMSAEMPAAQRALPVLKVLYRNTSRIQARGGRTQEVLRPVAAGQVPADRVGGEVLREQIRRRDIDAGERTFAAIARGSADDAFNNLLIAVQDGADVHRIVLPYRAWDMLSIVGQQHAHTMLRQSVRFCVREESPNYVNYNSNLRSDIPRLLDQHRLLGRPLGTRTVDDAWIDRMCQLFLRETPVRAADAAAGALAEGIAPAAIGEAISLAANQLVLRDRGRPQAEGENKPAGSTHGDSIGVHASDSANAWRNIARVSNPRNTMVSLIMGAWQVTRDRTDRSGDFQNWQPYPLDDARERVTERTPEALLAAAEEAIRGRDQQRACAVVAKYGELNLPARSVFDLMLRYAVSEDGALHAEKYYRTVSDDFAMSREAFRWRHLIGLARVTASEFGYPAPGMQEARRLLNV